jgi:hypothetical protein
MSRLQKVETRNLQLAGTGERLMISNGYNCHNARSPVPVGKNLLFAGDSQYWKCPGLIESDRWGGNNNCSDGAALLGVVYFT